MKALFLYLVLFLVEIQSFAQINIYKIDSSKIKDPIYFVAEEMAQFPGGIDSLKMFINKNLQYVPHETECAIQGSVFVRFAVLSNGCVDLIHIFRGVDPIYDLAAFEVIAKLPAFKPAKMNGKPVNTWMIVPVKFILE